METTVLSNRISMAQDLSRPQDGRVLHAFGQEAHVLISSEQTADAFCLIRFFIGPSNATPPHLHENEDETFIIEAGEVEVKRGGEMLSGKPGEVIYLPKEVPHAPQTSGERSLQVLVLCVPGGFDRFFAECAEEFKQSRPDPRKLEEIAARYGIRFL
jgi:mannose-6-phosphate isomerase-like protein (cupin superfamily)